MTVPFLLVEISGIAFLRKSHGGYDVPPAPRQVPPFDPFKMERDSRMTVPVLLVEISGIEPLAS